MTTISRTGVYGVAISDGRILLVKQSKGPHKDKWDLPGGRIEFGETIEGALHREIREEVAMEFQTMHLIGNLTATTGDFHQIGLIYRIDGLSQLACDFELKHEWLKLLELEQKICTPFAWQVIMTCEV